jgi:hypothetical protein
MEETIRGIFPFSAILCLLEYDTTKQVKRQKKKVKNKYSEDLVYLLFPCCQRPSWFTNGDMEIAAIACSKGQAPLQYQHPSTAVK